MEEDEEIVKFHTMKNDTIKRFEDFDNTSFGSKIDVKFPKYV